MIINHLVLFVLSKLIEDVSEIKSKLWELVFQLWALVPFIHLFEHGSFTQLDNCGSVFSSLHLHRPGVCCICNINHFQSSAKWTSWLDKISKINLIKSLSEDINVSNSIMIFFDFFESKLSSSAWFVIPCADLRSLSNYNIYCNCRFIITNDFFASVDSWNKISSINCTTIHSDNSISPVLIWEK